MSSSVISVSQIRQQFIDFFVSKGHTHVASSSLVPWEDPTILFTNAGMNQFKDCFLGIEKRAYVRATSSQRCVRAGGKHNDLENVGYTARHHTFFEMLGNFSFGDYFKRDAIKHAWELLTTVYKLPKEKLWVTVYAEDDEAYNIWADEINVPRERIVRIGDNKGQRYASDNFWMMGDTGPCGPCSEIFYDHGEGIFGGPPGSPDQDGDRYIEIWNLVFMQYNREVADGPMIKLPKPSVDTGMGLERLSAVLQHVHTNYEIDLFQALINAAAKATACTDLNNPSLRVIADHIRACAFLVCDGVIPSSDGRGYVLRRIARRAMRHGYKLGQQKPFFYTLVETLAEVMGDTFPEIRTEKARVMETLKAEEERFGETLVNGMEILEAAVSGENGDKKMLDGDTAFKLYDTFGFPIDLTEDIGRERNFSVDMAGFEAAMKAQQERSRAGGKFATKLVLAYDGANTDFKGYDTLQASSTVLAIYFEGAKVAALQAGQAGIVVLDKTPFYAESGGQVGDQGLLSGTSSTFTVTDTQKIQAAVFGHHGTMTVGVLKTGDVINAQVDGPMRARTVRHHSATHLMHKALREVLGTHVQQKGSLVDADKTRFDFAHNAPMSAAEIAQVEAIVNNELLANVQTHAEVMGIEAAQKSGAMMLFGEKYGDEVRVLEIGSSKELCGGCHVSRTGDIGVFKITAESGVAAGVRRVEAVAGSVAFAYMQGLDKKLSHAADLLKAQPSELDVKITALLDHVKALEKQLNQAKSKLAASAGDDLAAQAKAIGTAHVLAASLEGADSKALRETLDKLRDKLKSAVVLLASTEGGKVSLIAGVTPDLVGKIKAGELVNFVALQVGGKGGGRPDMAQAGGTDVAALPNALASVHAWVATKLA